MPSSFVQKCVCETAAGLSDGLSRFSGSSRVALIYSPVENGEIYIYDPYSLLRGHELLLSKYYLEDETWKTSSESETTGLNYSNIQHVDNIHIDGLISFGGRSITVPYQIWFTEHHPNLSSTGPTERWLEHAVLRFSHDVANKKDLYTGISGNFLREYSTYAIRDHIERETKILCKKDFPLQFYPVLNSILAISKTREEGRSPQGELVFVDPQYILDIDFLARFTRDEQPQLDHHKHVCKLLQAVENSDHKLLSDGHTILGISNNNIPGVSITVDFQGRVGFLKLNDEPICSFADGRFQASTQRAKLFEVEEAFLDTKLDPSKRDPLFQVVSRLVHHAENKKHGCTLVIDLNDEPLQLAGQKLESPLDLNQINLLNLAARLTRVDGALHIDQNQQLQGFACLLDGHSISGEDRARGARYNSALRFTAENPKTIIVVVSSDHPVSIVQQGIEIRGINKFRSDTPCNLIPEPLENWLKIV